MKKLFLAFMLLMSVCVGALAFDDAPHADRPLTNTDAIVAGGFAVSFVRLAGNPVAALIAGTVAFIGVEIASGNTTTEPFQWDADGLK